jgi:hypothetical protein
MGLGEAAGTGVALAAQSGAPLSSVSAGSIRAAMDEQLRALPARFSASPAPAA